jgi:hypothetical protein
MGWDSPNTHLLIVVSMLAVPMALAAISIVIDKSSFQISADRTLLVKSRTFFGFFHRQCHSMENFNDVKLIRDIGISEEGPYGRFTIKLVGPRNILILDTFDNYEKAKDLATNLSNHLHVSLTEECAYPHRLALPFSSRTNPVRTQASSETAKEIVPASHDALVTLIAMDVFVAIATGLLKIVHAHTLTFAAYFSIVAVVIFFWSCRLVYNRPDLPPSVQFLLGLNAVPMSIILAPFTMGFSILFVAGALVDDTYKKAWPVFSSGAVFGLLLSSIAVLSVFHHLGII